MQNKIVTWEIEADGKPGIAMKRWNPTVKAALCETKYILSATKCWNPTVQAALCETKYV